MTKIQSAAVYCGASSLSDPRFDAPTIELGKALANAGITLVYGGGSPGLMGKVANACMGAGGKVIGVIPDHILKLEPKRDGLSELHIVGNMHERKMMMADKADAFVIMPGGFGTLEEAFEVITWKYLAVHDKKIIIANIDGYWNPLLDLFKHMHKHQFVRDEHMETYVEAKSIEDVMGFLVNVEKSSAQTSYEKI